MPRYTCIVRAAMLLTALAAGDGPASAQSSPTPPGVSYRANVSPSLTYQIPVKSCDPSQSTDSCAIAGTVGQGLPIHALDFQLTDNQFGVSLRCTAVSMGLGSLPEVGEGQDCGRTGSAAAKLEGISLRLINGAAFTIQYRCHIAFAGWTGFVSDGVRCGTPGLNRQIEALQVVIRVRPISQNPQTGQGAQMRISGDNAGSVAPFTLFFDAPILPVAQAWTLSAFAANLTPFGQTPRAKAVWSNFNFTGSCQTIAGNAVTPLAFVPRSAQVGGPCPGEATFDTQQSREILFYGAIGQQGLRTSVFKSQPIETIAAIQDAKSLSVPNGRRLAIYANTDLTGGCVTITGGVPGTKANLLDFPVFAAGAKVRSLVVDLACGDAPGVPHVVLFDAAGFNGSKLLVLRDIGDLNSAGFGSKAASLKFANGVTSAALYDQPGFQGACSSAVVANHPDLGRLALGARRAQSIRIGTTCHASAFSSSSPPLIADVQFVHGASASVPCPPRTEKILPSLNDGAGGDFIFLCLRYDVESVRPLRSMTLLQFAKAEPLSQSCSPWVPGSPTSYFDSAGQLLNLNRGVEPNGLSFNTTLQIPERVEVAFLTPCPQFGGTDRFLPVRDIKIVRQPPFSFVRSLPQAERDRYFQLNDHSADTRRRQRFCSGLLPGYQPAPFVFDNTGVIQTGETPDLNVGKAGADELYLCYTTFFTIIDSVGTLTLANPDMTVRAGESAPIEVKWEVPEGRVWRDVASLDVRVGGEGDGLVLWVRLDIAANLLRIFDGVEMFDLPLGAKGRFQTPLASIDLDGVALRGSGPTGRTFSLTLPVTFKPELAGTVQKVDVLASAPDGTEQREDAAGTVTIPYGR